MDNLKRIGDFSLKRPLAKALSERAELVGKFTDKLNAERDGMRYKKLKPAAVAVKLSHIKSNFDLYAFYRQCEEAKSFSRYFWWALKVKE